MISVAESRTISWPHHEKSLAHLVAVVSGCVVELPKPDGLKEARGAASRSVRTRLFDHEIGEAAGLFDLDHNIGDDRVGRAVLCPVHEPLDPFGRSFEDCLDPPIVEVAHPSVDPLADGHAPAGVTEEDALNPARDQY